MSVGAGGAFTKPLLGLALFLLVMLWRQERPVAATHGGVSRAETAQRAGCGSEAKAESGTRPGLLARHRPPPVRVR